MKKLVSLLICLVLILNTSGCAGMKITGKPFDKDGDAEQLITFLDQGIGKATKADVKSRIDGWPEIQANNESERWIYRYEENRSLSWSYVLYSIQQNKIRTKELDLVFKKDGLLASYTVRDNYSETKENSTKTNGYLDRILDSIFTASMSVVILAAVNALNERAKK